MKHQERYVWLDLARGISAIEVCVFHLRYQIFQPYVTLSSPASLTTKLFYAATAFGPQAVYLFFVLSGFFVGGSIVNRGRGFNVTDYLVTRLTRLWIVLIPALLATAMFDTMTKMFTPRMVIAFVPEVMIEQYSASLVTLLGNVAFLQRIFVPVFGSNAPLWSLTNEFWYYMVFPLILMSLGVVGDRQNVKTRAIAGVAASLAFFLIVGPHLLSGFVVWLMGVVAFAVCKRLRPKRRHLQLVISLALFGASLAYAKNPHWQSALGIGTDIAVGLGSSLLCVIMATWPQPGDSRFGLAFKKFSKAISESSYSLYLVHFPLCVLITSFVYGAEQLLPDSRGALHFCFWLAVLLSAGGLFWFAFERHTASVRREVLTVLRARLPHLFDARAA